MPSHASQVPQVAADYFRRYEASPLDRAHPIIHSVFRPASGWKKHPSNAKFVSGSELRKLKASGATYVGLHAHRHLADFSIDELLRSPQA